MPNAILTRAIDEVASGRDLSADRAAEVLAEIMHGEVSEIQIAGFLVALRTKGETVSEIAGLARTMRELAAHVPVDREDLLDTAGTGGGRSTFNVSTTAALIAAGAGCAVAKHGNRSATSRSGSADLLEALGARIDLDPAGVAACIREAGFGFMFAPAHHQATRFVIPVRRELASRTVFNLLGPLTNPAGASRQLIGVSDGAFLNTMAGALAELGVERALLVSSQDGLDEISSSAPTRIVEVNEGELRSYVLDPSQVGVLADGGERHPGGTPQENAALTREILDGSRTSRPAGEALAAINAGAAIYAAGVAESIAEGVEAARAAIADGRAEAALDGYLEASRRHAPSRRPSDGERPTGRCSSGSSPKRARSSSAAARAARRSSDSSRRRGAGGGRFREALAAPGIGVIAEFKRARPRPVRCARRPIWRTIVPAYERGGAAPRRS